MNENVFNENVDYLYQVQTDLEAVEELKKELIEANNQEKSLKKAISTEEKSIHDEIVQTIRQRKNDIEKAYDDQIDVNKSKTKSVRAKRDKAKSKRIDERVSMETADLTEENRQLQVEMRTLFKAQRVPKFCMSKFFYSLFMTKRFGEFMILVLSILICYLAVPALMYYLSYFVFFKESKYITLWCTLVVSGTLFVFGFIYVLLLNFVKIRHFDTLQEGRHIMDQIAANKRQIRAIRNKINKDKDESVYGLDKFDDKILELEDELERISEEKQEAMTVFESETKQLLTNEINDRRLGYLEQMKAEVEELEKQISVLEDDVKNSNLAIISNYGAVLGKDFCNPAKVADLISLMEDGTAQTVSEAIAAYKGADN